MILLPSDFSSIAPEKLETILSVFRVKYNKQNKKVTLKTYEKLVKQATKITKPKLMEKLREWSLPVNGNKTVLQSRICDHLFATSTKGVNVDRQPVERNALSLIQYKSGVYPIDFSKSVWMKQQRAEKKAEAKEAKRLLELKEGEVGSFDDADDHTCARKEKYKGWRSKYPPEPIDEYERKSEKIYEPHLVNGRTLREEL